MYKTINLINGKYYIGKHKTTKDYLERDQYMGSGTKLKEAIKKYGKNNFRRETIAVFFDELSCFEFEQLIVDENVVNDHKSYNLCTGGMGGSQRGEEFKKRLSELNLGKKLSETTKKKISQNHHSVKGSNNPMYGKKHSQDTKNKISQKLSIAMSGNKNPMYGQTHSDEVKKQISDQGKLKWDNGSREKMMKTLSKGIFKTPWGEFHSASLAVSHPDSWFTQCGTIRDYCLNNYKNKKSLGNKSPSELGFSFDPS